MSNSTFSLDSSSIFIRVLSLPGARYVEYNCAKKFMEKLTVLAVTRATACWIPLVCQFSSSTTPFLFYYAFRCSLIFLRSVAAWCQVRLTQLWSNFRDKFALLAVTRATVWRIPRFCQSASRTTPFPFYYTLSSSSIFIRVQSLPGARYVLHDCAAISRRT